MNKRTLLGKEYLFEKILFLLFAVVMAILLFSHTYNDLLVTTRHGMNFWRILFSGEFFDFYTVNRCASGNVVYDVVQGCAYNILVYIIFAVWNLPLLFLEGVAGVDVMNNVFCIAYCKSIVAVAMVISAIILKKIIAYFGADRRQQFQSVFLYITSALMISTIFIIAQYDIFSVVVQLLGFYGFVRKKDRQFIFWFGIAFCFKFFSLIIFLPLILLRYKKIWQWLKALVLMAIPFILTKAPFILFATKTASSLGGEKLSFRLAVMLLQNSFSVFNAFVIVYVCLLAWCCFQEESNDKRDGFRASWACFVAYAAFCGLLRTYPYWTVFLAPFIVLVMVSAPKKIYLSTVLETIGLPALVLMNILRVMHCYFGNTMKPMAMSWLFSESRMDFEGSLIHKLFLRLSESEFVLTMVTSVFVGAMVALAVITYPKKNQEVLPENPGVTLDKDIMILRFLITAGICLLPIVALFI